MGAVRNKEISTVIMYIFSRFAISTTHLLSAVEEMKNYGVEFVSVTKRIETNSPMGFDRRLPGAGVGGNSCGAPPH